MLFPRAYAASPKISALHACLADALTGKVIYEYNGSERAPMASTTKIMTAVLALENMDMSEIITVSENAARQEGSSAYFAPGDKVPAEEVIYGLMLNSGNDAAVAIAEHISGSSESFAELMNEKARQLGALDTNFSNPNGLDSQSHYTTVEDLAKITAYALKNDEFRKIVSEKAHKTDYSSGTVWFSNHNNQTHHFLSVSPNLGCSARSCLGIPKKHNFQLPLQTLVLSSRYPQVSKCWF